MSEMYRQCTLVDSEGGFITTWIPTWAAIVGYFVTLKDSEFPKKKWRVNTATLMELPRNVIDAQSRNYKKFQGSMRDGGID